MSDDLISRKEALQVLEDVFAKYRMSWGRELGGFGAAAQEVIEELPIAFDKEKVIEELKSWEKASHDAGIQSTYAELDNKASGYYQESRAYHRAIEIVEKGGIE